MRPLRVLVACECSGRVRDAFAALGHDAWSCDLEPSETPGNHIQADVLEVLYGPGTHPCRWDMVIAHPPCTYLSYACKGDAALWHSPERVKQREAAVAFALKLWRAPVAFLCLENSRGELNNRIGKADQTIQPWMFGDRESKRTCLWLRGLPPLQWSHAPHLWAPRATTPPEPMFINGHGRKQYAWMNAGNGRTPEAMEARRKARSRTFPGIAKAMAEQWGPVVQWHLSLEERRKTAGGAA